MNRQRRTFTPAFKREAASLVLDQGYSFSEAAMSLDVGETALRRWVTQLQLERGGVTPTAKALTPEQQTIQEFQTRINRLELKKNLKGGHCALVTWPSSARQRTVSISGHVRLSVRENPNLLKAMSWRTLLRSLRIRHSITSACGCS